MDKLIEKLIILSVGREKYLSAFYGISVFLILSFLLFIFPPYGFPAGNYFEVESGDTTADIVEKLDQNNFIRSAETAKLLIKLLGGEKSVKAGDYFFEKPFSAINITFRLRFHRLGYESKRITILEGSSNKKIADTLAQTYNNFNVEQFLKIADNFEGELFPDTYFFSPNDTPAEIVKLMVENFNSRIEKLENEIKSTGKTLHEIITMASIIERETITARDRRIVSGILWKRLAAKMPLQVDATFEYYLDRNTFELTKADLKSDSPYNTYLNRGLPPTPISNPGWDSILAAVFPEESEYWYYLSDMESIIHYAKTFDEHIENRKMYGI